MNPNFIKITKQTLLPTLAAAAATLLVSETSSLATLTYDLRVTALNGVSVPPALAKNITVNLNDDVTFTIYAQVTGTAGDPLLEGVQSAFFSLVSDPTSATKGNFAPATINPAFPSGGSKAGTPKDTNLDGFFDRLGVGTTASAQNTAASSDIAAIKDVSPNYAGTPILDGQEFALATTVFHVAQMGSNLSVTVVPSIFTSGIGAARFSQIWGENAANNTSAQNRQTGFNNLTNTAPNTGSASPGTGVTLIAVPEPAAFGMVILGAMGLVGFRRLGVRRA